MQIENISNFIALATGITLLAALTRNTIQLTAGETVDLAVTVGLLKLIQLLQIADLILILTKKSKGSALNCFFQLLGRNVVSLYFVSNESNPHKLLPMCWAWTVADCLRYLYYLNKDNNLLGHLRYNAFIILYPYGVYHEMLVINDYIKLNAQIISDLEIFSIRFVQLAIILGMCSLYIHMVKSRNKYYQKQTKENPSKPRKTESPIKADDLKQKKQV